MAVSDYICIYRVTALVCLQTETAMNLELLGKWLALHFLFHTVFECMLAQLAIEAICFPHTHIPTGPASCPRIGWFNCSACLFGGTVKYQPITSQEAGIKSPILEQEAGFAGIRVGGIISCVLQFISLLFANSQWRCK